MREFAKHFYRSSAWKKCRLSFIAYRHGLCERCHSAGTHVHHKSYLNERNIHDPNVTLAFDNLELLCHDCHNDEHMGNGAVVKGLAFDEAGRLYPRGVPPGGS